MKQPEDATLVPSPPPFEPTREDPPTEGFHYEWARAHDRWSVYEASGRRCRFTVGPGGVSCKRPAVAVLNRARRGQRRNLWGYCEDHLYGRVLHDGVLWDVVLRPDSDPFTGKT